MNTLLFIHCLLEGNYDGFMVKLAIVLMLWMLPMFGSVIDLITGIAASKRIGTKHTTSWGIRRTISKDLQYLALLTMMLLIDVGLSTFSDYLPFFSLPVLSGIGVIGECVIEGMSVVENIHKGRNPEEDSLDDVQQLAAKTVEALGSDKTKALLEAIQKYEHEIKH